MRGEDSIPLVVFGLALLASLAWLGFVVWAIYSVVTWLVAQ